MAAVAAPRLLSRERGPVMAPGSEEMEATAPLPPGHTGRVALPFFPVMDGLGGGGLFALYPLPARRVVPPTRSSARLVRPVPAPGCRPATRAGCRGDPLCPFHLDRFWASCLSKRAVFCRSSAGGLIGRVGPSMKDFKRREDPQKSTILSRTAAVFELPIRSGRNTPHPQLKPPFLRPHSPLHPRPVPHLGRWLGIGGCWRGGGWWGVGWWRKPENRPLWHVGDWGFRVKEDE
nr:uncharacterized protein LOC116151404 isoform X2 [Camelus dromedarius]